MIEIRYSVDPEVFARFPDYVRGVVIAEDVRNPGSADDVVAMLRSAESSVRQTLSGQDIAQHPRIASWREAYRAVGAKPSEFRSSVEAMARRLVRNQEIPSINTLVDIGNTISLEYLLPIGGHAIDVLTRDIALRPATGAETFIPFGSDAVEHPEPGEYIFAEGDTVLTRRWTWRQANHTLLLPTTRAVEFNVDVLAPVSRAELEVVCAKMRDLILRFCGGRVRTETLAKGHPVVSLTAEANGMLPR